MYINKLMRKSDDTRELRRLLILSQLCHAFFCSLPLVLTSLLMVANATKTKQDTIDFRKLVEHGNLCEYYSNAQIRNIPMQKLFEPNKKFWPLPDDLPSVKVKFNDSNINCRS